jgi:glycosyltransferase involved in cell wall biosynthesis
MRRQWSINGRFLTQSITGVQRYGHEVLRALDELVKQGHGLTRDLDVELLVPPGTVSPPLDAIGFRSVGRVNGHVWEQSVLPRHAPGGLISLCNTGPLCHHKHIVCMHDVNTRSCPGSYSPQFRALYRVLVPLLGRSAATVATVSRYSAEELVRYGICSREKIALAPDGHEHALQWVPQHSHRTRSVASRNTVVMVGSPAPHKNVALICRLAGRLKAAGLRIAVVGLSDPRVFSAGAFEPDADNITWTGRLSDDELAALLADSLCLAFPSFVEGFGLPPLEAMALGCPVIASDRASLPEICGNAALYASPTDPDAWFCQFVRLHNDQQLRAALIGAGRVRAQLFTWSRSAETYLSAMARADSIPFEATELALQA